MGIRHLRVYYGPEDASPDSRLPAANGLRRTVTVPLSDVVQALAHAVQNERQWLEDFAHDEVTISTDLYEIILAYQYYRQAADG